MDKSIVLFLLQLVPVALIVVGGVRAFTQLQTETKNQGKLLEKVGASLDGKVSEDRCGERHSSMEKLHRLALQAGEDRMRRIEGNLSEHGKVMRKSMDVLATQVKQDIGEMSKSLNDHMAANGSQR